MKLFFSAILHMMIPFDDRFCFVLGEFLLMCLSAFEAASWRQLRGRLEWTIISSDGEKSTGEDKEDRSVNGQSVFTHEKKKKWNKNAANGGNKWLRRDKKTTFFLAQ
jgi:hypothetical protein